MITRIETHIEYITGATSPNEVDLREINETSRKQISLLEELKEFNLKANTFSIETFHEKWKDLIEDESIAYAAKIDIVKQDLILNDGVYIKDLASKTFMSVWAFGWFNNKYNLQFLKYLKKLLYVFFCTLYYYIT